MYHIKIEDIIKKSLHTIDRSFDAGNRENFILNEILLIISILLMFLVGLHILEGLNYIIISKEANHLIHQIEFFFGILFLIEFILRTIYVYIPDKKFLQPYTFVTFLATISLLFPQFFNIAFLRIIWIIKMFKIYHMRKESHIMIAKNPEVAHIKKEEI